MIPALVSLLILIQPPPDPDIERKMQEFREELRKRAEQVERETIEEHQETQRQRAIATKRAKAKEQERVAKIMKQPEKFRASMLAKKVAIGMNAEQAILAWGKSKDINSTITAHGIREQWVYGPRTYLYLDNGIVTAIQN